MQVFTKDIIESYMLIYIPRYWAIWGDWFDGIEKKLVLLNDFVFLLVACNTDFSSSERTA